MTMSLVERTFDVECRLHPGARMRRFRVRAFCASVVFAGLAVACSDAAEPPAGAPVPPPTETPRSDLPVPEPIAFAKCSLQTTGSDGRAECANVEVPLDWSKPDDRKVTFFVKRLVGSAPGPHAQLWLLQGGPGGAGDGLEDLVNVLSKDGSIASFDVYLPDHRGTGRSAYLDCPTTRGDYPFDYGACAAEAQKIWGKDGFTTFTTTTAARDVGHVIERTRMAGQGVHVYGVSYGTYWAQRYLQLFPTQPTAVTLDSVCGPGLCSYMKIGYWFDHVGKKFLGACSADPTCSEKMGPDPVAKVRDAIAVADARTCAGLKGLDAASLRQIFTWFIASGEMRPLVPAVSYRAVRCNADDVTALTSFVSAMRSLTGGGFDGSSGAKDLSSTVLGFHIAFSEMEPSPPTSRADLAKMLEGAVFTKNDATLYDAWEAWPKYPRDEFVGRYPDSSTPLLLLNGTLDPQTPQEFAEEVAPHYGKPNQTFVLLPRAAHGTLYQSPMKGSRDACGMVLWKQFLGDPKRALDTSCTGKILDIDFSESNPLAKYYLGTSSLWGIPIRGGAHPGEASAALVAPAAVRAELERAMRVTTPWVPVAHQREQLRRAMEAASRR